MYYYTHASLILYINIEYAYALVNLELVIRMRTGVIWGKISY